MLELEDLVCGCALDPDGASRPLVTPIKDSLATKIRPGSTRLGGCIYYPLGHGQPGPARGDHRRVSEVASHLRRSTLEASGELCAPGQTVRL